ncbi:hypothetical protein Pelo_18407 [Pelomyxa schiedti]|nr:hypothetical protein Pelo_18407 [Pelomyxa schiedti]
MRSGDLVKVLESVLKIDPLAVSENQETVATPVNCAKKGCTLLAVVFCPQCDKSLCKSCSDFLHEAFFTDHAPAERSHEFFTVKHVIQSARKELSELCTSLNLCKSRLDSAIGHLKSISDDSELHIKLMSEQVEREFSLLRLSSQEREEDLKRKLREMNSPRAAEVGEQQTQLQRLISSIDESVRYCEVILRELEADPMALLNVKKQIKDHLTELSNMALQAHLEPVLPPSHAISFPKTILHPEQWGCSGTQDSFDLGLFSAINKHGFIQALSAMTVKLSSPGTTTSELNQIKFALSKEVMTAKYPPQSVTNDKMHQALTPTLIPPMECVVLPQPGSRFCEQHRIPLTILCWGPNPSTSKAMPPPPTPNNSTSTPTQRGHPKIICAECLFSGDHIGHTNHEHLPVAEKRLRASLKGTLDALIKQCTEVLEVKSNAELQLKELQVQVNQCNGVMETGVQQSVKSTMENLRVCQVNLEKIATSKVYTSASVSAFHVLFHTQSKVLQDAVTESRNQFYVLSNSIALGKRLCSSFQQQSGGGGVKPMEIPSMKCPADGNASSFSFLDTFIQLQPIFEKAIAETPTGCAQSIVSIKPDDTTPEIKEVMDVVQEITKDKGRDVQRLQDQVSSLSSQLSKIETEAKSSLLGAEEKLGQLEKRTDAEVRSLKEQNSSLSRNLSKVTQSETVAKASLLEAEAKLGQLENLQKRTDAEVRSLKEQNSSLSGNLSKVTRFHFEAKSSLVQSDEKVASLTSQLKVLGEKCCLLQRENTRLQENMGELSSC